MVLHSSCDLLVLILFLFQWPSSLDALTLQAPQQIAQRSSSGLGRAGRRLVGVSSSASSSGDSRGVANHVVLEYCTGCRWMARSFWMAQELLTTFNDDNLSAVTIQPSRPPPGARFVVSLYREDAPTILWDRTLAGGFPELKELKQSVRDEISPDRFLGHSDKKEKGEVGSLSNVNSGLQEAAAMSSVEVLTRVLAQVKSPNVAIQYCTGCRWMLRAAYLGTELMSTFGEEINSFTLIPSRPPEKGGIFTVTVNGNVVWDRAAEGFPDVKQLKRRVRDMLEPSKDLGRHIDTKDRTRQEADEEGDDANESDDEGLAEMKAFYGVL